MQDKPIRRPKILFDEYHSELNTLSERKAREMTPSHPEWHSFQRFAEMAGAYFEVNSCSQPLRSDVLSDANVLMLAAPRNSLTPEETKDVVRFVQDGGGLIKLGDAVTGESLNGLLANFGMFYRQGTIASRSSLWDAQSFVVSNVDQNNFVTRGIHELQANWAGVLENRGDALVLAATKADSWLDVNGNGHQDAGEQSGPFAFILVKQFGKGRVLAVADNSFTDSLLRSCDNRRFIVHALVWLSESH
jgi:hypothetical protein